MSLTDLKDVTDETLAFDLVIIGSGPAGLVLASELMGSGLRVAVLESGGLEPGDAHDARNSYETVGQQRAQPHEVRCRGFGGSSALWTGRCGTFDPIDFHARPWLALSGWPLEPDTLRPYYHRAGPYLGLSTTLTETEAAHDLAQPFDNPAWDGGRFRDVVWQSSNAEDDGRMLLRQFEASHVLDPEAEGAGVAVLQHSGRTKAVNIGERLRQPLENSKTTSVFLHATASQIETDREGKAVQSVLALRPDGSPVRFHGRCIVLAAGGIENARLLLASRGSNPQGLGNDRDQVGRYLTDHHFTELGAFHDGGGRRLRRRFGSRWHGKASTQSVYCMGVRLAPALQRKGGFLNAAISMVEFGGRSNALTTLANAARGARSGDLAGFRKNLVGALARPGGLATAAHDRFVRKNPPQDQPERTLVGCVIEQELDPESRVTLSEITDELGQPVARIDWRLSRREYETAQAVLENLTAEIQRLGLEKPVPPSWVGGGFDAWKATLLDLAHPSCTTRMSSDPAKGVVDANCKLHGIEGLYLAGSSVFPTPGYMNPTHTLVSLSIRLADHLRQDVLAPRAQPAIAAARRRMLRVGLLGGGHRTATVYAPVLEALRERFTVAGVVTRSDEGAARISGQTGWSASTDLHAFMAAEKPDLIIVALPTGANDVLYEQMVDLGVPLMLETPFCWNELRGRKLLKKIEGARRLVTVAEQFPFLPEYCLWQKLIGLGFIGRIDCVMNDFAVYDYHGIGLLRSLIGRDRRPVIANGTSLHASGQEDWLLGSVGFEDGSRLVHTYSAAYVDSPHRPTGEVRVYGTHGTLSSGRLVYGDAEAGKVVAEITRHEAGGGLERLSVETPDGTISWANPFAGAGLTDEQIAVAQLLNRMGDAVDHASPPPYAPWAALEDVELLAAMRYSAMQSGQKIDLPFSPMQQKLLKKARQVGQRIRRRGR